MCFMETNVIYCGDNAEVMRTHILDNSVDLIYADPPFFSNKQYEVLWGRDIDKNCLLKVRGSIRINRGLFDSVQEHDEWRKHVLKSNLP